MFVAASSVFEPVSRASSIKLCCPFFFFFFFTLCLCAHFSSFYDTCTLQKMHFSIPFQLALVTGLSPLALAAVLVDHGENSPGLVARDSPRGNAAPSGLGADAPACAGRNTDKKHRLVARGNGGCWGGGSPRPVQGRFGERRPSEDDWPDPIDTDYSRGSMSVNDSPQAMSVSHSQESMSIHYPHSSSSVESSPKKIDSHSSKDPKMALSPAVTGDIRETSNRKKIKFTHLDLTRSTTAVGQHQLTFNGIIHRQRARRRAILIRARIQRIAMSPVLSVVALRNPRLGLPRFYSVQTYAWETAASVSSRLPECET